MSTPASEMSRIETGAGTSQHHDSPTAALELSRWRLREALLRGRPQAGARSGAAVASNAPPPWLANLKALPVIGVAVETLTSWWAQHPLRVVVNLASGAALGLAQPMARTHPLALLLGSLALGAALVWTRPWRWLVKPALFAGLLPLLASKLAAAVPMQALMEGVISGLAQPQAAHSASPVRADALTAGTPLAPGAPPSR